MAGSGGGASGAISFPAYIVAAHGSLLDQGGTDGPELSIIAAMNTAIGASPFAGAVAYDPTADIGVMDGRITAALAALSAYSVVGNYGAARTAAVAAIPLGGTIQDSIVVTDDDITESMQALDAVLTEDLENIALPRYKAGMLNINAVQTSSFVIGEAIIRGMKGRDVAKHGAELRVELTKQARDINARHLLSFRELSARHFMHQHDGINQATTIMMGEFAKRLAFELDLSKLWIEEIRIRVVMGKEELEEQLTIDESDARWDLETFRYVGNFLAAPSGGVAQATDRKNRVASALGGALSGAAAGAVVGSAVPGVGTAIGAGVGALVGGLGGGLA